MFALFTDRGVGVTVQARWLMTGDKLGRDCRAVAEL